MLKCLLSVKGTAKGVVAPLLHGHAVEHQADGAAIAEALAGRHYDVVVLEDREAIAAVKAADPRAEIIFIGNDGTGDEVELIRAGASACFAMPLVEEAFKKTISSIDNLAEARAATAELERQLCSRYTYAGVVGRNPLMIDVFAFLRRVAPYFKTITIYGETGSGKELVARALHSLSPGAKEPFIAVNCGGFVETLLESELFGHKKGAFTGAIVDKAGVFEAARNGTVFLDEIGDIPLSFQPHLLRVLQNGEFRSLGSNTPQRSNCRVIAATNKDLSEAVKRGRFREDLYFRLTPLSIEVPPLRRRKDDIPLLTRFLLERFHERTGKKIQGIARPAQTVLISYDWPGNVRELESVIEEASILTKDTFIRLEELPVRVRDTRPQALSQEDGCTLDEVVQRHIKETLTRCNNNKTHAASALGITRRALLRKLEKYGLE
ncbi:MAG: sigma-54-dependent Fis family transcriptional regulator [Deltaproteobacteria bacterium]|nr:sigma-54-dependent Fis family transcriptional regulator [Deltaproteobacteria bacterium]